MSILIRGMEMPQKCGKCKLYHVEHPMHCMAVEGHRTVGAPYGMSRPDWCPLIEIPTPHSDLVDRNKLLAEYDRQHEGEAGKARKIMEQADAVIEAEGSDMKIEVGIANVVIKYNKVNLCDSCRFDYPTCATTVQDIAFGDGKGNDNVCVCSSYIPVAYRQGYNGKGETE